jgi:hypothetical protein
MPAANAFALVTEWRLDAMVDEVADRAARRRGRRGSPRAGAASRGDPAHTS